MASARHGSEAAASTAVVIAASSSEEQDQDHDDEQEFEHGRFVSAPGPNETTVAGIHGDRAMGYRAEKLRSGPSPAW